MTLHGAHSLIINVKEVSSERQLTAFPPTFSVMLHMAAGECGILEEVDVGDYCTFSLLGL